MKYYAYKAVDASGSLVEGMMEADDLAAVNDNVSARGLFVVRVSEVNAFSQKLDGFIRGWRISRTDIIEFASNLSFMLHAGVPVVTALEDIANTMTNRYFKPVVKDIKDKIEMGMHFSEALAIHKHIIPPIMVRLVTVGEETGRLEDSLSDAAGHLQKQEDLNATVKRALIYPTFALITTGGALIFWFTYVLPKIMEFVTAMGVKMPPVTMALFHLTKFTGKYWWVLPAAIIAIIIVILLSKLRPETKYYWDLLKLKIPIVRAIVYNKLLAMFSEQLRLLVSAGITIDKSFDVVAQITDSEVLRRAVLKSKDSIVNGSTIAGALGSHKVFPPLVVRMANIGESSGSLDDQFAFLATYYFKIVDDVTEKLEKLLEPILVSVLGIVMAVMIAAVFIPMYDVISKIR
ncbi:MAG: type II secretion system F family protein [Deltaproteobacteria bacterium]|nr:type II secretion system F family protein [Deltaproteobacteria bacterium]